VQDASSYSAFSTLDEESDDRGNVTAVSTWRGFSEERPELADAGRELLYQFGVGLAFLGTTRPNGGPRLHPICPQIYDGGLYAFIVPSPKQRDLLRDGRFALHSFPCPDNEDAFYLTGRAQPVDDADLRLALTRQFLEERAGQDIDAPGNEQRLFSFDIEACLLTRTKGHGDPRPVHTIWHAC
jgi:hypothetical protein